MRRPKQHSRGGWTRDTASREARGIRRRDPGEGTGSPGRGRGEGGGSGQARRNSRFPSRRCEHLPRGTRRTARARRRPRPQAQRRAGPQRRCRCRPTGPKPGRGRPKRRPPGSDTGCDTCRRPAGGAVRRRRHTGRLELSPRPRGARALLAAVDKLGLQIVLATSALEVMGRSRPASGRSDADESPCSAARASPR